MQTTSSIFDMPLSHFIAALAAPAPAPGAGAAGAVALALAAACAAKAAHLSARHAEDSRLEGAGAELEELARRSLVAAENDAQTFTTHLQQPDEESAARLEACGQQVLRLADAIDALRVSLQGRTIPSLAGDLTACAALLAAGRRIQRRNLAEAEAG
jgi:hypothetical protein